MTRHRCIVSVSIFTFLLPILLAGAIPVHASTLQNCRSADGGFCVKIIDPPDAGHASRPPLTAQFAAVGLEFLNVSTDSIGDILVAIFKFGTILVAISAVVMIIIGAVVYMTGKVKEGKSMMTNAVYGLLLILVSWLLLYTINPHLLVKLQLGPGTSTPGGGGGGGGVPLLLTPQ